MKRLILLAFAIIATFSYCFSQENFLKAAQNRWPAYTGSLIAGVMYQTANTAFYNQKAFNARWPNANHPYWNPIRPNTTVWNSGEKLLRVGSAVVIGCTYPINFRKSYANQKQWYLFLLDFAANIVSFSAGAYLTRQFYN